MKRLTLVLALASAACSDQPDEGAREMREQQAIAAVEAANNVAPPLDTVVPEPILQPDIERHDILGASCSYAPGMSLGARVIARQADAFMKIDGEIARFAADPGSRELPLETRSLYNGREYSLRLEIEDESEGEQAGAGTGNFEGIVTLRDRWGRIVYSGTGLAQCAS